MNLDLGYRSWKIDNNVLAMSTVYINRNTNDQISNNLMQSSFKGNIFS